MTPRERNIADILLVVTYSNATCGSCTGPYPYLGSLASRALRRRLGLGLGEGVTAENLDGRTDGQLVDGQAYIDRYLPYARRYYGATQVRINKMETDLATVIKWL